MNGFTISISGPKDTASRQIGEQVSDPDVSDWLHELVRGAPGTHVSLTGSLNAAPDRSHGSISLSGSFWTKDS